jgi:hypothetical protein
VRFLNPLLIILSGRAGKRIGAAARTDSSKAEVLGRGALRLAETARAHELARFGSGFVQKRQ